MSEDLISKQAKRLGRFGYLSLGSTTLAQLKRSKFIRQKLQVDEESRKPDGIVFLPLGGIKAVVEVKQPKELEGKKLAAVIKKYAPIARAVCRVLIITDCTRTYWINALSENPIVGDDGKPLRLLFDAKRLDGQALSSEEEAKIVACIEKADYSLSETCDQFQDLRIIDPSSLAKSVWQKLWINSGKEPGQCLYYGVESRVFRGWCVVGVVGGPLWLCETD